MSRELERVRMWKGEKKRKKRADRGKIRREREPEALEEREERRGGKGRERGGRQRIFHEDPVLVF